MKLLLPILLTLVITCSCNKKKPEEDKPVILDTQLAEVKKDRKISRKQSRVLLQNWNRFVEAFHKNDKISIGKLSMQNVNCPIYDSAHNYYLPGKPVSLVFFINAPCRNFYQSKILSVIDTATSSRTISFTEDESNNISSYKINFTVCERNTGYLIWRNHSFEFIKIKDEYKFNGLQVDEWGSRKIRVLLDTGKLYFPLKQKKQSYLFNIQALDTFTNRWFSEELDSMKEPNLYTYKGRDEIYRFTWLRSFNNPIAICIKKDITGFNITTKVLSDNGGYTTESIKTNTISWLLIADWFKVKAAYSEIDFWKQPVEDPNEDTGNDGAEWILEANVKGQYHFTVRWSPAGKYRQACLFMLSLSGLKNIKEEDIY